MTMFNNLSWQFSVYRKMKHTNMELLRVCKFKERVHLIEHLVEKPTPGQTKSDIAMIGRYILSPDIFELLGNISPGHGMEIQLTDALVILSKKQKTYAYEFEGERFDAGDKLGYLKADNCIWTPPS